MLSGLVTGTEPIATTMTAEYLVSHGKNGGFGRFAATPPLSLRRGDRVVIQTGRGLEIGCVLCPASERHVQLLATTPAGRIVRRAETVDDEAQRHWQVLGREIFDDGRDLAVKSGLGLEVIDVEILLDGATAVIQFLGNADDYTSLIKALERKFGLTVLMESLAQAAPEAEAEHGCGKPDCGKVGGGGCTSCGTGGGCSSCGSGKVDMTAYFAHLRTKMNDRFRTPLL